jgi:predicted  nucleic acid-binding Zn-ribbon protein
LRRLFLWGKMDTKETLALLKQLQQALLNQQELRQEIARTPVRIEELDADTVAQKQLEAEAEEALKNEKLNASRLDGELKAQQETLSNKNLATLSVKTNEQLWAIQKEIKFLEDKISGLELDIISSMEATDGLEEQLKTAKSDFIQHSKENTAKIAAKKKDLVKMEKEIKQVDVDCEEINKTIPANFARLLARIQSGKSDGQAMVEVRDEICLSCNYRVRPQVYLDVKLGKAIHQCSHCSKILFYVEHE